MFKLLAILYFIQLTYCFPTWSGGPDLDISFDPISYRMKFVVTGMPQGTWLGVIYGESMFHNDVVLFQQTGSDAPNVQDRYAFGYWLPREDKVNNYEDVTAEKVGDKYNFVAYRKLNTGDYEDDTMVTCGSTNKWMWAGSTWTGALIKHDTHAKLTFTISEGCTSSASDGSLYFKVSSVIVGAVLSIYSLM